MGNPSSNEQAVNTTPQIDFMRLSDLPQVMTIEKQSFTTPWSHCAFTSELTQNDRARYLVARLGNLVIGYIGVWLIADEGHITNVAVHPEYRRRGVGRMLMLAMEHLVKQLNGRRLTLEVRVSNKVAQHLYKSLGYVSVGVRPGYYQDNHEDALIMWKEI